MSYDTQTGDLYIGNDVFAPSAFHAQCENLEGDAALYCHFFVEMDKNLAGENYETDPTSYAWYLSYIMRSYLTMYQATGQEWFLHELVEDAYAYTSSSSPLPRR